MVVSRNCGLPVKRTLPGLVCKVNESLAVPFIPLSFAFSVSCLTEKPFSSSLFPVQLIPTETVNIVLMMLVILILSIVTIRNHACRQLCAPAGAMRSGTSVGGCGVYSGPSCLCFQFIFTADNVSGSSLLSGSTVKPFFS